MVSWKGCYCFWSVHCGLLNTISLKNSSALCNFYCSHVNVILGYVLLLIYDFNLELGLALADPRGGEGGGIHAPSRSNFFHFHAVFGEKIGQIIAFPAHLWSWHPLWEILDLPLVKKLIRNGNTDLDILISCLFSGEVRVVLEQTQTEKQCVLHGMGSDLSCKLHSLLLLNEWTLQWRI